MAIKKAEIRIHDKTAGWLIQDAEGYHFQYDGQYLLSADPEPVSLTLPLQNAVYDSNTMFPFFDGKTMVSAALTTGTVTIETSSRGMIHFMTRVLLLVIMNSCIKPYAA